MDVEVFYPLFIFFHIIKFGRETYDSNTNIRTVFGTIDGGVTLYFLELPNLVLNWSCVILFICIKNTSPLRLLLLSGYGCDISVTADRFDCGWPGIKEDTCLQRGCCWDDKRSNANFCYMKKRWGEY